MNEQNEAVNIWLLGKISDAEKALKIREGMVAVWRTGTDSEWFSAAEMHPSTFGQRLSNEVRLEQSNLHERVASKLRHELAMFRALRTKLAEVETK
jgi:hypothetical protein